MTPREDEIERLEQRLLDAMLLSDVDELDKLLADDLTFTDHEGGVWSKADDLAAHRSGAIQVDSVVASEQRVRVFDGVAIVAVRLAIVGTFGGYAASGAFRFTRVWVPSRGGWQVVVAHSTLVAERAGGGAD
jgi:ketosteroid isomerase-like protein